MNYPTNYMTLITKKHTNGARTFTIGYYDFTKKWIPVKDIKHQGNYTPHIEAGKMNAAYCKDFFIDRTGEGTNTRWNICYNDMHSRPCICYSYKSKDRAKERLMEMLIKEETLEQ